MTDGSVRVPPHSVEAEQAVLGALFLEASTLDVVSDRLEAADFYREDHGLIFGAVLALAADAKPFDAVTVFDFLSGKGVADKAGGMSYLGALANDTVGISNVTAYRDIIADASWKRGQLKRHREAMDRIFEDRAASAADLSRESEAALFELAQRHTRRDKGVVRFRDGLKSVMDKMTLDAEREPGEILGLPGALSLVNRRLGGYLPGHLYVVGARPAMGKTTHLVGEGVAFAQSNRPVLMFSMEMPAVQIFQRMASSMGSIPLGSVMDAREMRDDHWHFLTRTVERYSGIPFFVDDTPALDPLDVAARSRRLARELRDEFPDGLGAILVDYIQLMRLRRLRDSSTRASEIEEITGALKRLAKELDCPVVALSQLNRSLESRPNKRPVMSDLRESGAIEQDADVIQFIYRDEVYNAEDSDSPGEAEIITAKWRNGEIGTDRAAFQGQFSRFRDLAFDDYSDLSAGASSGGYEGY